ncbi:MAG: transposase-like protein [Bacteroidia bacterium]|jgi:transposase-like protein
MLIANRRQFLDEQFQNILTIPIPASNHSICGVALLSIHPSHRDIEDLLAQRGITRTRESTRLWCNKFRCKYSARLHKRHQGYGDTFFVDEVFLKICGAQH